MLNTAVCTIISADYIHYALALNESIIRFQEVPMYILIVGGKIDEKDIDTSISNIEILYIDDLYQINDIAPQLIDKYNQPETLNELRWSAKPLLLSFLVKQFEKALYLDADLFFYNNFAFILEELSENNVVLTPHWRNSKPLLNQAGNSSNYEFIALHGLFNAGFIGVNNNATQVLDWWANICTYRCEAKTEMGYYYDQLYLNLIPVYFDKVKILQHRGCNVSAWNEFECKRTLHNGEVLINDKYPIIFVHYAGYYVKDLESGKDSLMQSNFVLWKSIIEKYKHIAQKYKVKNEDSKQVAKKKVNLLQKIRIKTRIKKFLQG